MNKPKWSEEEIEVLREMTTANIPIKLIARKILRSPKAIEAKRLRLALLPQRAYMSNARKVALILPDTLFTKLLSFANGRPLSPLIRTALEDFLNAQPR